MKKQKQKKQQLNTRKPTNNTYTVWHIDILRYPIFDVIRNLSEAVGTRSGRNVLIGGHGFHRDVFRSPLYGLREGLISVRQGWWVRGD